MARVASFATVTFAAALVVCVGTPGFAREINSSVNTSNALSVPALVSVTPLTPVPAPVPLDPATTPSASPTGNLVGTSPGDTVAFGTLAAAVAAQSVPEAMGEDLSCLAGAIYFEAKGEPLAGQLAVAEVIKNRAKSGRFPRSICSVVTQPGQFSFVRGGHIPSIGGNGAYRTAVAVARVALDDVWDSPAPDAMYFHARRVSPGWGARKAIATIGNHVFYR